MKADHRRKYILYPQAFENAKWVLTNKKSGKVSEYDYSKMSSIVINAYISHNSRFAEKPQGTTIRYLSRANCEIYSKVLLRM